MSKSFSAWVKSDLFLHSNEWHIARLTAKARADYRCETPGCWERDGLHVHHIHPRHTHPLLALDQLNLEVLCPSCHSRSHGWRKMPKHWHTLEPANDAQFELPLTHHG